MKTMLRISTKGRYGLRLMVRLAKNFGNGPMLLSDLSKQEDLSLKYAEHLVRLLKPTKLLKSYRGANGGYELALSPEKVNIKLIIEALEGTDYPVECLHSPDICDRSETCPSKIVWNKLEVAISQTLESINLGQLLQEGD